MNTITNKGIAFMCYKKNDGTTLYGTFEEVPMDAYVGIINLQMPYIDKYGEIKYKDYIHRIYCGDDLPAKTFLQVYGKTITAEKLQEIKDKISEGFDTIIIPLGKSKEFAFLTKEDQLCKTRGEFEDIIYDFKTRTNDVLDFITLNEETRRNIK